jgi:hypothetical protein
MVGCRGRKTSYSTDHVPWPTDRDVIGLTEAELRAKYPETTEVDWGFSINVSKTLYPYSPPRNNQLLRIGKTYLVVELKDGKVIALHRIKG